jgi:hypothetical protein
MVRMETSRGEIAKPLLDAASHLQPDPVDSPSVVYSYGATTLVYPGRSDEHFVRVSFDRWDALRVCRGEYPPFTETEITASSIFTVESSSWLRERYDYEYEHYGKNKQYCFGADVGEMLHEFEHFLFVFHDEFVEVIAAGVCFETRSQPFEASTPLTRLGLDELPDTCTVERFEQQGIHAQLRKDPRPRSEILAASRLCDQSLYQLALEEHDGSARVTHRLTVRTQHGETKNRWRSFFGRVEATLDGFPEDDRDLRPLIARYVGEVAERRTTK